MQPITFQSISLNVVESTKHTFLLSTRDVAAGYEVNSRTIQDHKQRQSDELIEGTHFIMTRSANNAPKTMWTKLGVVTLGFFIKSEKAKEFRKWAANYVLNGHEQADNDLKKIVMQQNEQIAQLILELNEAQKRIEDKPDGFAHHFLLDMVGQIARYVDEEKHIEILRKKRRENLEKTMLTFVRLMKNSGLIEQSMLKSENINHYSVNSQR